jgi:4-hydroxybenzoate polyprenyltransferase
VEAMRPHQWLKNILMLVPLVASTKTLTADLLFIAFVGFFGFSLVCSGNYILNDIRDVDVDKSSSYKRELAIASGDISKNKALFFSACLLFSGLLFCSVVSLVFFLYALFYLCLALTYTLKFKSQPSLRIVILVAFYEFRILLGGVLFGIEISFWLLLFSFTVFSSLACLKSFAKDSESAAGASVVARKSELSLLSQIGISSGIASLLSFSLYLNSSDVALVYSSPKILWIMVPMLQFLVIHLWRVTFEGRMHYDPIIFILRDMPCQLTLCGIFVVLTMGRIFSA